MVTLGQYSRKVGIALLFVLSLTILSAIKTPVVDNDLTNWLPGASPAFAETSNGGH